MLHNIHIDLYVILSSLKTETISLWNTLACVLSHYYIYKPPAPPPPPISQYP